MKRVILDIEADGFLQTVSRVWVIVCKDIDTHEVRIFRTQQEEDREAFRRYVVWGVDTVIGHHILGYDLPALVKCNLAPRSAMVGFPTVVDTLVVSRLVEFGRSGGHSLDAWGEILKFPKIKFTDFSKFSEDMVTYCVNDVELNHRVYENLEKYINSPRWKECLEVEHDSALFAAELSRNGFQFDVGKATSLLAGIVEEITKLDSRIHSSFLPKYKPVREVVPRSTKFGTLNRADFRWLSAGDVDANDLTAYQPGAAFTIIQRVDFNPASTPQIIERLNDAGWRPTEKTKGHISAERELRKSRTPENQERVERFRLSGWKVSEGNLATLPDDAPEGARALARRIVLANRRVTISSWLDAAQAQQDNRIHAQFNTLGAWTQRWSHEEPNVANIPNRPWAPFAREMRELFIARDGYVLVGVDADSIQLRVLAHYMDDERFTNALVSGDKQKGTDPHSLNKVALGDLCKTRDHAKTFIYAWLLGASAGKVGEILECSASQASKAMKQFLEFYPGLKRLKEKIIPRDAERGYFIGFDGRAVRCDDEHLMLAGYLQNGESVIMKKARQIWSKKLADYTRSNIVIPVNFVHDEWQTEVRNERDYPLFVAKTQAEAIREAGEAMDLKCPMLGTYNNGKHDTIGQNWYLTH